MELKFATRFDEEHRARHDAVKLLSCAINIRRARERDGEFVVLKKRHQVQIARRARRRVRRAGIERRAFSHIPAATAINFRRGYVDVFFEKRKLSQLLVQSHVGDDVGLIPLVGMQPAFGDHALRSEIYDVVRLEVADGGGELVRMIVQVELKELELRTHGPLGFPFVGEK